MADMALQSAILQSALEALDSEDEVDAHDADADADADAMDVEVDAYDNEADGAGDDAEHAENTQDAQGAEDPAVEPMSPSTRKQMLPPPHGKEFATRDAVESWLKVYCNQQGYSVSCRRCVAKGVRGWKAVFYCSRGRPGDSSNQPAAKRTKKIGCPMEFNVDCLKRTDFKWIIDTSMTLTHNHGPAVKPPRPVVLFPRRRKTRDVPREVMATGKLEGRRALMTGADPGIGRSIAVLFAREGADMTIIYLPHEQKDAERTQRMVEAEGRACLLIPGNLMDETTCQAAVDMHVNRFGMISVLVNNASKQTLCDDITKIDLAAVKSTFRTNVLHMIAVTKYAVPHIERGGSIINTTSAEADRGSPTAVDYSASQGAVVTFTRSLDKQLVPKGIRVNAIALTSAGAPGPGASSGPAVQAEGSGTEVQIGESVRRKEAARLFVFLAALESSALHGQVLNAHLEED